MGFNRITASADVSFPYICSRDTALAPAFVAPAELSGVTVEERKAGMLDRFAVAFPGSRVPRAALEALDSIEAIAEQCDTEARRLRHARYRETGEESDLGFIGEDVIRWRLRMLTPAERAHAKGALASDPPGSRYEHYYKVNRQILSKVLIGADGWIDFNVNKDSGCVSAECLDLIDEEWILEIGDFCLELPSLRKHEKKV